MVLPIIGKRPSDWVPENQPDLKRQNSEHIAVDLPSLFERIEDLPISLSHKVIEYLDPMYLTVIFSSPQLLRNFQLGFHPPDSDDSVKDASHDYLQTIFRICCHSPYKAWHYTFRRGPSNQERLQQLPPDQFALTEEFLEAVAGPYEDWNWGLLEPTLGVQAYYEEVKARELPAHVKLGLVARQIRNVVKAFSLAVALPLKCILQNTPNADALFAVLDMEPKGHSLGYINTCYCLLILRRLKESDRSWDQLMNDRHIHFLLNNDPVFLAEEYRTDVLIPDILEKFRIDFAPANQEEEEEVDDLDALLVGFPNETQKDVESILDLDNYYTDLDGYISHQAYTILMQKIAMEVLDEIIQGKHENFFEEVDKKELILRDHCPEGIPENVDSWINLREIPEEVIPAIAKRLETMTVEQIQTFQHSLNKYRLLPPDEQKLIEAQELASLADEVLQKVYIQPYLKIADNQ